MKPDPSESLLPQSEHDFRSLIETMEDLILISDPHGRIIYSNPAVTVRLGHTSAELRAMSWQELYPPWLLKEARSIFDEVLEGVSGKSCLPLISRNGVLFPMETQLWQGRWNGARAVFALSRDLSNQQEALSKFEKLFKMNPALIAISTIPDRRIVEANDAFLKTLGYTAEEVKGRTSTELEIFADAAQQERVARMLEKYGSIREVELTVRTKKGHFREGLFSSEIIESQGVRYDLTLMIDITERKRAENEREGVIQELRSALEQIRTLRGIVPICSSCKKIRDDKGFWEQVESYIARHTEALFSHSICPDCVRSLYPDFQEEDPTHIREVPPPEPPKGK